MQAQDAKYQPFVDAVIDFCEGREYSIRHTYSGRAMYGKTCLGVVVPRISSIADLYFHLGWTAQEIERPLTPPKDLRTDDMGQDIIVYWPTVVVALVEV